MKFLCIFIVLLSVSASASSLLDGYSENRYAKCKTKECLDMVYQERMQELNNAERLIQNQLMINEMQQANYLREEMINQQKQQFQQQQLREQQRDLQDMMFRMQILDF